MKKAMLLALLASCATTSEQKGKGTLTPVAEYYPLAVGNSWTYDVRVLGAPPVEDTISIVKEEGGHFVDSKQQVIMIDSFGIRDDKRYLLRAPLEVGAKWNSVVSVSSYEQYQVIEVGQACEAPAGKFMNCVVVESRNKADAEKVLIATLTFAPKVGVIRVATELETKGQRIPQVKLELTKYQVGQGAPPTPATPATPATPR